MPFNSNNIQAGPSRIFLNVSLPTTGAPPTLVGHTNGVPADGVEVGYTTGPVEFTYQLKKNEVNPEQSYAPVDVYPTAEIMQVTFEAMETTYTTILRALDNIGTVNDSSKSLFYMGNGSSIISPFLLSVFFSSAQHRNAGKYSIGMLYRAYSVDGLKIPFQKSKETTYKVTFTGTADSTRTAGDQLGQFYIEK